MVGNHYFVRMRRLDLNLKYDKFKIFNHMLANLSNNQVVVPASENIKSSAAGKYNNKKLLFIKNDIDNR